MIKTETSAGRGSVAPYFVALTQVVSELTGRGIVPTAAGAKNALMRSTPDFNEKLLGFTKFIEFVEAAAADGNVVVFRDENNHPRIVLPDGVERAASETAKSPSSEARRHAGAEPPRRRLRRDVWNAIVDWAPHSGRLWDRVARNALTFPVDDSGAPRWLKEGARFAALDPIPREAHVEWMRLFASQQQPEVRKHLLDSLSAHAPLGGFKRALQSTGLEKQWHAELQRRVLTHVEAWASANDVSMEELTLAAAESGPRRALTSDAPSRSMLAQRDSLSETERLRARLHSVIDTMAYTELAAIPIPAAYLTQD